MIRVVVADDDPSVRALVRTLLTSESDYELVAEASDGSAAMDAVEKYDPDLLILDLSMPRLGGAEVLLGVKKSSPATRVLVLTAYPDTVEPLLDLADSRLSKTDISELMDLIREITT